MTGRRRTLLAATLIPVLAVIGALSVPVVRHWVGFQLREHHGAPDVTSAYEPFTGPDAPLVRLAAAGDVGTGGDAEYATTRVMDDVEADDEYDAVLLLGDNVYPNGDPDELDRTVFRPFQDILDNGTLLLPALGNHDVRDGNADAHAEAIGMPARWYGVVLDDVLIVVLDSNHATEDAQRRWLDETLAANESTWTIVTMHHPPYSGGYHGSDHDVRDAFSDLFEQHGVQLVLAGHDHDYQRSQEINGVTYVVSGGAAKLRPAGRADFTEVAWSTHHFVDIAIWTDRMVLQAIDHDGRQFDEVTIAP